jgi:hypothetical protein
MVRTGANIPSTISKLLHSNYQKSTAHIYILMTPTTPATVMPTDDCQFVSCVDLALTINSAKWEVWHPSQNVQMKGSIPVSVEWHYAPYHFMVQYVNSLMQSTTKMCVKYS